MKKEKLLRELRNITFTKFLVVIILISSVSILKAQQSDKKFIEHLYYTNQYNQLINYGLVYQDTLTNKALKDSILFLIGKSQFQKKNFKEATNTFDEIHLNFPKIDEAIFLKSYSYISLMEYKNAKTSLNDLNNFDTLLNDFKYFELSGIALLERNEEKYYSYNDSISNTYYFFKKERASLNSTATKIFERRQKSPFVGGLLTALVPGAGRFYAGKRGQAIYSLLITSFLALQTWESYQKNGIESPRFIIYGSLLTAFHIGNIWGSALSVKNYKNEYNKAANYSIELDLLIPIRSFYK